MSLPSKPILHLVLPTYILMMAGFPGVGRAANGDLLLTSQPAPGKSLGGLCADSDGTFWALGETSGRIYHLDSSLARIGDIANPHGTGQFPQVILGRGIAFRPSTETLLVLAKDAGAFKVKEVTRSGVEVPAGAFSLDTSASPTANLYSFSYDSSNDQVWLVDDTNDRVVRYNLAGSPVKEFGFPLDVPPESTLRGVGVCFRMDGAIPFLYLTRGDIFTLAPSRILELTVLGQTTGFEIPLDKVPTEEAGFPVRQIGAIWIGAVAGKDVAIVVGDKGVIHELDRTRPNPLPPTFLQARVTKQNQVRLTWVNHGNGVGGSYPGGIAIGRNGQPLVNISGSRGDFLDENPPAESPVSYTVKGSNGGPFSPPAKIDGVVVGPGGLVNFVPFPGSFPTDITRDVTTGESYVTDAVTGQIYHFDKDLVLLGTVPSPFAKPGGCAFNPRGNSGAGSLMVATNEGVLIREIDLQGNPLDQQIPLDFQPVESPHIGGLAYHPDPANPDRALYTCVETTSRQLVTFDRNGNKQFSCTPPEIFTQKLTRGLAFEPLTGNFYSTFENRRNERPAGAWVRELFPDRNCTPAEGQFAFALDALGETSFEPDFTTGIEIQENCLLVCGGAANAIFEVLVFPRSDSFIRGDVDGDGQILISDAVRVAGYLFKSETRPNCLKAADANDDGTLDISDPVYLLFFLFVGGSAPPDPYPTAGPDPTRDSLEC